MDHHSIREDGSNVLSTSDLANEDAGPSGTSGLEGERRSSASNSRPAQISTANAMLSPSTDGGHATVDFQQTSLTDDDYDAVQPLRQSQRPPAPPEQNLVIVSNRLPINVTWDSVAQQWALPVSSGGLVSALMGVGNHTTRWVGWPGSCLPEGAERDRMTATLRDCHASEPVWLPKDTLDLHYNGFCNAVLWQLFHYVPVQMDFRLAEAPTLQQEWGAYQAANELFADAVLESYHDGEVVWIQDYHLMLLPNILKQRRPSMKVGFFLHTPFPSSEIYRTLPYREELLRGVLKADLIGFHTYDYVRHFISSCTRILGLEGNPYGVEENGTLTRVAAFPIGINPLKFETSLKEADVAQHVDYLKHRYAGLKVMLGVDRLDMIKGIPQKLLAFEKFLEDYSEWRDRVVLVQIAVPSRLDVPEYQQLRSQVHEIVGRINGRFGTLTHVPIHHLDRKLSFKELCALYAITDVALVTSLRDGMNLVSYEFVACQAENHGVLVLSEFAGAAQSLGAGSILVNPWNIDDMTTAIHEAVCMSPQTRKRLWKSNFQHVSVHTAQTWGDHFLMELHETCANAQKHNAHHPPPLQLAHVAAAAADTQKRLIVLGYNAALKAVSVTKGPQIRFDSLQSGISRTMVDSDIMQMLRLLAADSANVIVIISGATAAKLCTAFASLLQYSNVWLAAENGTFMRPPPALWEAFSVGDGTEWVTLYENLNFSWVKSVEQVFEYFSTRTPRSVVETRETSVVWNYKLADYEFGKSQAQDMLQHLLTSAIGKSSVDVVRGARSLEVRMYGVNKGISMSRVIDSMSWILGPHAVAFDLVLCIGHFMPRDESIFSYFEGKDIVNVDVSGMSRDIVGGASGGNGVAEVLATINPGMSYPDAVAAGPQDAVAPAIVGGAARPRMSSLGSRVGSRIWTVDSFDESAGMPADRAYMHAGASLQGNSDDAESARMSDKARASASSLPRPPSPTSPTLTPPPSRDTPNPPPLQRPLTRSRSSLAHAPPPLPSGRSGAAPFPGASVPGSLVAMYEYRPPSHVARGIPLGAAAAGERVCDVFGASPSAVSGFRLGHTNGWVSAVSEARLHGPDRRSASGSLAQEAATSGSGTPKAGSIQLRVFPPAHLFTVTMGRSRSLARFCTEGSEVVAELLRAIVNPTSYRSDGGSAREPRAEAAPTSVPYSATPPPTVRMPRLASAASMPPAVTAAPPGDLLPRRSIDHATRARLHPISTGRVYDRDAPGSSGARDGGAHAQTTVAQTLVDACDSYDSATSLLSHTSMAAVSGAGATSVDSAGSSRAAGNAGGGVQRRKSMSVAPPPRALSPAPRQAAVLAVAVMAPRQVPSPFMASAAAAPPLPPGVSPPSTAASPVLPEAAPQPPAPAAAAAAGRPDGMDCADGPSVAPMAAALASPMPSAMPRRSLSSSGLAQVDTGGDGGDGSGGRRTGVVGVRSWEPRAQSMQLSAQMTAVARTTPGDDCSTLFDAMGRPVPLAHALSAAATDASTGVGRRHSKRQFARADSQVTNSFESTYAPEYLPGLSSLPLPHMLPGIRSEGDLTDLVKPRGSRMASFDLTPQYRSVRDVADRQTQMQAQTAASHGNSAPGVFGYPTLAEHASEASSSREDNAVQMPEAAWRRTREVGRTSSISTGTDAESSLSSCARARARVEGGDGALRSLGVLERPGASLDGSVRTRSSIGALSTGAAGGRVVSSDSAADSGPDFVLSNPGRIAAQTHPIPIRENDVPVLSHAISDLPAEGEGSLPRHV